MEMYMSMNTHYEYKTENNGEHRKTNTNITVEPAAPIYIRLHESDKEKGQVEKLESGE
jgi:hypothetical protein